MNNLRYIDASKTVLAFEDANGKTVTFPTVDGNAHWDAVKNTNLASIPDPESLAQERLAFIDALRVATHEAMLRVSTPTGAVFPTMLMVYLLKVELLVMATSADPGAESARTILARNAAFEGVTFESHLQTIAERRSEWMDRVMQIDDEWMKGKRAIQSAADAASMKQAYDAALAAVTMAGT